MIRFFLFTLLFSVSSFSSEVSFEREISGQGFEKLYFSVKSKFLNNQKIPVFVYTSPRLRKPIKPVLFLHGKGFSRGIKSDDGMLDYADLNSFYKKEQNENVVFIAPQDIFFHKDNNSAGHDYWIGKEGRNWPKFFGEDFDEVLSQIEEKLKLRDELELTTVLGISMGAHGAISMGRHFPKRFTDVYALSPVFRPVKTEIPESDVDVFQPESKTFSSKMNMGNQILNGEFKFPRKLTIHISNSDFGMDTQKFPHGVRCWENLKTTMKEDHHLQIHVDNLGHSMKFWKKILLSLNF